MQDDHQLIMQTLLQPLVNLLLPAARDNQNAAWDAAVAATSSYSPTNLNEFQLAASIVLFNVQANHLIGEANTPGMPLNTAIRMRQCALSYVREANKAERRLEQLQASRPQEEADPPLAAQQTEDPVPSTAENPTIPDWKRRKQERRLAKQQARDARMQSQAPDLPQPHKTENRQADETIDAAGLQT